MSDAKSNSGYKEGWRVQNCPKFISTWQMLSHVILRAWVWNEPRTIDTNPGRFCYPFFTIKYIWNFFLLKSGDFESVNSFKNLWQFKLEFFCYTFYHINQWNLLPHAKGYKFLQPRKTTFSIRITTLQPLQLFSPTLLVSQWAMKLLF